MKQNDMHSGHTAAIPKTPITPYRNRLLSADRAKPC
jgi:hypothetical protein